MVTAVTARTQHRPTFVVMMTLIGVALGTSAVPAPLYGLYADKWDFDAFTTTIVFAVYSAGALVSVLVTGPISDRFGRKPAILTALVLLIAGLVVFITANGVASLLVARTLHGLAVGAITVAVTAALLDLRPDDGARSGRNSGVALNTGVTVTLLVTGWIVDHGPAPFVLPFAVLGAFAVVLLIAIAIIPETHTTDRTTELVIARPRVPAVIRHEFRFSALGAMSAWSVLGVFLSLYPGIAARAIDADGVMFGAFVVGIAAGSAAVGMVVSSRWDARSGAIVGDFGTAVTLLLAIPAVWLGLGWAIALDAALLGAFFGMAFGNSLRHLADHIPAEHRGEVMSAFYVLAYGAMAVPTVVAGWAAGHFTPDDVFAPFMAVIALTCTTAGVLGLRSRVS